MSSRLPRTAARRSPPGATPSKPAADHAGRLREAQENLEFGGAAIMAMTYMGHLGVVLSREALASEVQEMEADGVPTGEALQGFQIRRLFHEIAAPTAIAAVDSAAILYAHTVLTGVIDTLCVVSVELDGEAWTRQDAPPENTPNPPATPSSWMEHASLGEKCESLLRINRRGSHLEVLSGFKYSAPRLRKLDRLRQHLVEPSSFDRKIPQAEENVDYLLNTAQFFINLLAKRCAEEGSERRLKTRRTPKKASAPPEPVWRQGELL